MLCKAREEKGRGKERRKIGVRKERNRKKVMEDRRTRVRKGE